MLLTFKKQDATALNLGPFKAVRFEGGNLRAVDTGRIIAKHEKNAWAVRGEEYLRLDCEGSVTITFLDAAGNPSRQFGPYAHFSSVDGIGYRDHEVFCHLDEQTRLWFSRPDHGEWPVLVVEDA